MSYGSLFPAVRTTRYQLARQGRLTVVCPSAADLQRGQTTARPRCVQQAVSCHVLQALAAICSHSLAFVLSPQQRSESSVLPVQTMNLLDASHAGQIEADQGALYSCHCGVPL